MDSQAIEASDYANEGACASTTDDLIDKQVVAEKPFKSTEDVFPLMTRLQDDSKVESEINISLLACFSIFMKCNYNMYDANY